ncbi:MAG: DUF3806 domain-containing protein [Planctomycetota bacterium]
MMTPPVDVEELGEAEKHALEAEVRLGQRICSFYTDHDWDGTVEALDRLFDLWLGDAREKKPSPNDIALGLGALIGELLRAKHGCRWVIVTDKLGCDLGLISDRTGWQFFPRHWIAKRLNPANAGQQIIAGIIGALKSELGS